MSETVLRVENVGKRYEIGARETYYTLRDALARAAAAPFRVIRTGFGIGAAAKSVAAQPNTIWSLRHISFQLNQGDVLGVIGANGAGKSTLLKILSRITEPTEGLVEITGRVGSLLEVGTGFHPELTGRENVYLNGAILGMKRREIENRFDEIVGFAGVERFVDTPVKHYSSGMHMRLAFAVAAHLDTEMLMVDEVLAVGDAAFQLKCLNKMSEVSESGRTILFVSHNMEAVTKLCTRSLLLDEGRLAHIGTPQECVAEYLAIAKERRSYTGTSVSLRDHPGRTKPHNGPVQLTGIAVLARDNKPTLTANGGEPLAIVLKYTVAEKQSYNVTFAITFSNIYNHRIASCRSHDTFLDPIRVESSGSVICRIPRLPLVPGFYRLTVGCNTEAGHSDGVYDAIVIEVVGASFYPSGLAPNRTHGEALFEHAWEVQNEALSRGRGIRMKDRKSTRLNSSH